MFEEKDLENYFQKNQDDGLEDYFKIKADENENDTWPQRCHANHAEEGLGLLGQFQEDAPQLVS